MFIYTLAHPLTGEVRYIGKTKDLKDRLTRHIQKSYLDKYDKNTYKSRWIKKLLSHNLKPIMEVLDECDENLVDIYEKYWISQFKTWGFNLVNISEGGEIVGNWKNKRHSESTKDKIRKSLGIPIVHYDLIGTKLGEYDSLSDASKKTGCHIFLISNCCKKKSYYTVNNTTFRYKGDEFDYMEYNKNKQVYSKSITKYDLSGNVIDTFDSIRLASMKCNSSKSNIKRCCEKKIQI